jgi:hypothetical protein
LSSQWKASLLTGMQGPLTSREVGWPSILSLPTSLGERSRWVCLINPQMTA